MTQSRLLAAGLIAMLLAGGGCESGDDEGADGDAMTSPPNDAGLDAGEDGSVVRDGSAGDGDVDDEGGSDGGARDAEADASLDGAVMDAGPDAQEPDAAVVQQTAHIYVGGFSTDIIHLVLDRDSGALSHRGATAAGDEPAYLAVRPQRDALYAINESGLAAGSEVIAFKIDAESGELSMINTVPSGGEGAVHLSVHPTGGWIAVAHYDSGHVSILPVRDDRGLGGVVDIDRGPADGARKAHQAVFDARGTALFVPCLENNYVLQYQFQLGALVLNTPATVAVTGGPRHLAISADQHYAYVLSELGSTLTSFEYDGVTGHLANPQTIDSEEETKGASAHVALHPNGKWLYLSNRDENSLGVYALGSDGRPQLVEHERGGLATPRDFAIDPAGEYLIAANQAGAQNLRVYRIDQDTGALSFVSSTNVGGEPSAVAIVLLP